MITEAFRFEQQIKMLPRARIYSLTLVEFSASFSAS
jgi:hypothetical protein